MNILASKTITIKKKEETLSLRGDLKELSKKLSELQSQYFEFKANPSYLEESEFLHSENDDSKEKLQCLSEMQQDIEKIEGIIGSSLSDLQKHINEVFVLLELEEEKKEFNWEALLNTTIPTKADGSFMSGRVINLYKCNGFSWEDSESYGRRGYELIVKVLDAFNAELQLRTGMVEKW